MDREARVGDNLRGIGGCRRLQGEASRTAPSDAHGPSAAPAEIAPLRTRELFPKGRLTHSRTCEERSEFEPQSEAATAIVWPVLTDPDEAFHE